MDKIKAGQLPGPEMSIAKLAGTQSFVELSGEKLDLFDVDRVVWITDIADVQKRLEADALTVGPLTVVLDPLRALAELGS